MRTDMAPFNPPLLVIVLIVLVSLVQGTPLPEPKKHKEHKHHHDHSDGIITRYGKFTGQRGDFLANLTVGDQRLMYVECEELFLMRDHWCQWPHSPWHYTSKADEFHKGYKHLGCEAQGWKRMKKGFNHCMEKGYTGILQDKDRPLEVSKETYFVTYVGSKLPFKEGGNGTENAEFVDHKLLLYRVSGNKTQSEQ